MIELITEEQLDSIDIRQFHQVWAVRGPDDFSGVQIMADKRLTPFVSSESPAPDITVNNLLIIVDDVDDPLTINRLKSAIEAGWSAQ
ncbi:MULTISPECIES: hypothetical protein [Pseudomonas syringae group]|uniref:Uncharacterized protein n=1 Tax=Pseudomonas syringae pv. persicae TaxID=237306 RepID=A0AB38EP42_9PSED|nr:MULTISPECIES: hypothetical protein [Pseudomonas syringae group]PHN56416.1 hypothetical protein AO286_26125 [Pseudomonas syringae]RMR20803.1 hypothetical protein ALP89_01070 [Pseudomonas syringae pv. persicae]SOQ15752.1 hypothetical protein NCPPB2254_05617 [Pseudomonas syringae pv. persicae]SOQ15845.1 hypothetical protein CFBP1573P_05752 [Pseudomonas syringae pv. persicae]